jgi:COP9 signalosome complex subunit 6
VIVLGALLGTQTGREVEIVNTFELAVEDNDEDKVDHGFLVSRRDQCMYHACNTLLIYIYIYIYILFASFFKWSCMLADGVADKQVFPSLEFIGWYTVTQQPTARHIAFHEQVHPSFRE